MGTENPNLSNYPSRPAGTPFSAPTPFLSSGPVAGSVASAFRPASQASSQFPKPSFPTGPLGGSDAPAFRPPPQSRSNEMGRPPGPPLSSSSHGPPTAGFQRFQSPPMPSFGQSLSRQPTVGPPTSQPPSIPMESSPPGIKNGQINPGLQSPSLPTGPSYATARGTFQPAFPGYANGKLNSAPLAPPTNPASFPLQPRSYVPSPSMGAPPGPYFGNQMQHHGVEPPTANLQGLAENFTSLSFGSAPGSFDAGIDGAALPRPLDGDVELKSFEEMFPMNCSSRFFRLTTSGLPNSQSLASRWHLPLGAVVCPLAEGRAGEEVPIVNFATSSIIRCKRCRTYVNPFVSFTENGRKWKCNMCSLINDVPGEYFAQLDASGRRFDLDQRPELLKGNIEFIAPAEYMVRPPMPPSYFFLIDVSVSAGKSGMLEVMTQTVKSCLNSLPGSTRTQIGFITYDSTIHFYNMKSSLTQPQMMVVSDLDDVFAPLPDDLLVNLSESRSVVEAFLDSLPSMFEDNMNVESAFGPALKAAFMVMI